VSDCYCDFDGVSTVYRASEPVARKPHRCDECGRTIQPGERYESVFHITDGDAGTHHTCPHCLDIRKWVVAHVPCSCWSHGNMLDDLRNDVDAYWVDGPGLLFGYLRRRAALKRAQGWRRAGHGYTKAPHGLP
jgi:hypothetical protein